MTGKTRVLVVADETAEALWHPQVKTFEPDLVVSCGDLPFEYLEYLVSTLNVPLVFVPGNHDPEVSHGKGDALEPGSFTWEAHHGGDTRPRGCTNIDGRTVEVAGMRVAGLGGSIRYNEGPNQYTQRQMAWRSTRMEMRHRLRRPARRNIDLLVSHAPPLGIGDGNDAPHQGIKSLHRLTRILQPTYLLHGHIHPYGIDQPDRQLGHTKVLNVIPYKLLEVEP
jgi:Icc-related predicted phosphoesterase